MVRAVLSSTRIGLDVLGGVMLAGYAIWGLYLLALFWQPEFTSGPFPHQNIAKIYEQRRAEEFDPSTARVVNTSPRLVDLEQQCHPPRDCRCWIVVDPLHRSDIEREVGRGLHRPKASFPSDRGEPITLFAPEAAPYGFGFVEVRKIDSLAYSVLACQP